MSQTPEFNTSKQTSESVSSSSSLVNDTGHPRFAFVHEKNQPGARTHAMRSHWQDRRRRKQEEKAHDRARRPLRSKSDSSADLLASASTGKDSDVKYTIGNAPTLGNIQDLELYRFSTNPFSVTEQQQRQYTSEERDQMTLIQSGLLQGIPTQFLTGANHALSSSRLDPFDVFPVALTTQHHKLIHHWLSTHATMMFEEMPASDFNPMKDVWFPLDLSNAASFNVIMAHSAAHLAYYYGGMTPTRGTNSSEALKYKTKAVEILSQWLNDPKLALGNDAFAAVVRLLTFERYWGTEAEWQVHRDGLQRMIEARGGLQELHDDWRLELVVGLVSLMSQPTWFSPTNDISGISSPNLQQMTMISDIKRLRSLWLISFIQDMRNLMSMSLQLYRDGLSTFPALYNAVLFIQSNFDMDFTFSSSSSSTSKTEYSVLDYDRLVSLFSICIIVQESVSSTFVVPTLTTSASNNKNALALLDMSLFAAPNAWQTSVHALRSFLHTHFLQFYVAGAQKINYVMQMTDIISHLSLEAHRGIEKCLINILCRTREGGMVYRADDGATPDSLLSSLHGQ
ncbi:hypothetical protein BGW36DRAFT_372627 [Talaromyces proteolyticus]|uniref:Tachykinin family protein n=1 Tax=Talaromyces proteolyticus TaxID=1131652 RepID=A0AAD4KYX1_9EURO|nr:uncharacterized protein BGW36DRAFT_372627 [Talaromyces proteolyticus]KAH8702333.1 hypothetical protein BGW36DRAFT_372627 [Talaromyces proteolyticus]